MIFYCRRVIAPVVALVMVACAEQTAPTPLPVRLEARISHQALTLGDTATLTLGLTNTTSEELRLEFSSSCQIMPYILKRDGEAVYPASGRWGCYGVITQLTLAPGATHAVPLLLRGGSPQLGIYMGVPLAPGNYVAYARLQSEEYPLQSPVVEFSVR